MPLGTQWARQSQFNWTFDNMGGTPRQDFVAGLYSGVTFTVSSNQIVIPAANGGGSVYYLRGVWKTDALFAWGGFWAEPETGANYYTGGSYVNGATDTTVTLGTSLPDGTVVQAYYIYNTGLFAAKYDALNCTPCIREAWRSKTDYTYDFAVDRIFDAMAAVYFAYKEQGLDDETILNFFWKTYIDNAASHTGELVLDDFDRSHYDRSSYLIYYNSSAGQSGFDHFGIELPPGSNNRALRFKPAYYEGSGFTAWFGYGFSWDLTPEYFNTISKLKFKALGANQSTRVQKFVKTAGAGDANMVVIDEFDVDMVKYYLLTVTTGGAPGVAQANLQVYDPYLTMETDTTITCPAEGGEVNLGHGIKAYWESGTLAVGDTWYITAGVQDIKPFKLQVILNDSVPADADPFGEAHTFVHGIGDYYTAMQSFEIDFSQFWRLGNIIDCRDRKPGKWGSWSNHSMAVGTPYETLYYDVYDPEDISGETFYAKQRFTWNLSSTLLALGFYVGIPADVDSTSCTNINFLIKQSCGGAVWIRTKVRDAAGTYFQVDNVVAADTWTRISINLASFGAIVHPLTLVDIGIPSSAPYQGQFDIVDLKFDGHLTVSGASNLRVVEFKHQESSLKLSAGPDWYLDDFGFDLAVDDPYPYVPRLAISLNAFGRNSWRGPTLVHYSHPLAPFLVDRADIVATELQFHADAQNEFNSIFDHTKGPIMPVHTRNDIENIALCGEENFNKFCWWPDYPETGHALGQYWAFYRLAEYYFVSGDAGAWAILDNWLNWFDEYVALYLDKIEFPILFNDSYAYGFQYDPTNYDPGAAASIVVGCLYVYMRNGDSRALSLSQKILEDLRENRTSGDYGGYLYKSDYHYAWMNALVAHAFGLAVTGRDGAAHTYPFTEDDETHFQDMMANFWAMSGDSKPNLLNADLIPFHDCEDHDIWDYAPNYMFMKEMGSMEGVVLMLHTAIDWALYNGSSSESWDWFNTLLGFMIKIGLGTLAENQIYKISYSLETTKVATQVGLTYGNFRQDNTLYKEAEDAGMVARLGEIKKLIPMHYGNSVITENAATAETICNRTLEYFAAPKETLQLTADLAAARFDLSDVIKITSQFHGFDDDSFYLARRTYDKKKLRVLLSLMRDSS
jgi:hypothetical protein